MVSALILRSMRRCGIGLEDQASKVVSHYVGRDGEWAASDEALRSRYAEWLSGFEERRESPFEAFEG